jgi:hypothetical protein
MTEQPLTREQATQMAGAQAAQTMGTQAFGTPGEAASEQDIAAQASSGIGVTQADMEALYAHIKRMQVQLDAATRAAQAAAGDEPVRTWVKHLAGFVKVHADPAAVSLADDATEAAGNLLAPDSAGDTGPLEKITAKLAKHLLRHPPHPGENFHYTQAVAIATTHLPEALEDYVPPPPSGVAMLGSDRPAAKVLSGNVTG